MALSGTWAVLPVKPFDDAKSRLQPVLDAGQRRELARALMLHSLEKLLACERIDHVLVVSSDAEALALASRSGAAVLVESETGLNPALTEARAHATLNGAGNLLVVAGDLPLLDESDIDAIVTASEEADVVIAPDRLRQGTNALLLRPADAIDFRFGELSFQRHLDQAGAAGLSTIKVSRPGLAFDVDFPQDWQDLLTTGWTGLDSLQLSQLGL